MVLKSRPFCKKVSTKIQRSSLVHMSGLRRFESSDIEDGPGEVEPVGNSSSSSVGESELVSMCCRGREMRIEEKHATRIKVTRIISRKAHPKKEILLKKEVPQKAKFKICPNEAKEFSQGRTPTCRRARKTPDQQ